MFVKLGASEGVSDVVLKHFDDGISTRLMEAFRMVLVKILTFKEEV